MKSKVDSLEMMVSQKDMEILKLSQV